MNTNGNPLRVLIVDDSEQDALLMVRELRQDGYNPFYERVETATEMKQALKDKEWDLILCDYKLQRLDAPSAIAVLKSTNIDIPLIVISAPDNEESAVECMHIGAKDCIIEGNFSRLCPAIARELKDAEVRKKQKRAEKALRSSEEKYRTILANIQEGYFEIDLVGNLTFFNESACRILGYSKRELMGMNYRQFTDKEPSKEVFNAFNNVYNAVNPNQEFHWQMIRKDKARIYVEASASLQKDSSGKPIGFRGILHDITEHNQAKVKLQQTIDNLRKSFGTTVNVLVAALEARDPYTYGHHSRSAGIARTIATEMGLPKESIEGLRMAGSFYDIGKLTIPAQILSKSDTLTKPEVALIKEHAQSGYEILKNVESPWPLAEIVYQHHERMNGSGYPRNLKGDEILMESRILAVSDVMESMTANRPYRPALGMEVALEEIEKNKGILYDSTVADTCLKLFRAQN